MEIIRYLYPQRHPCPSCQGMVYEVTGHYRKTQYRRCACGHEFKVMPAVYEVVDAPGLRSRFTPTI